MKTLIKFCNFVKEINESNSRNYKLDVLKKYEHDIDIRYCLNFLYDPYIVTGISEKKYEKETTVEPILNLFTLYEILEYVKVKNTGSDLAIATVKGFLRNNAEELNSCDDYREIISIYKGLITKNLQLGVDVKSINKTMHDLIKTFSVQLANKYFDNPTIVEGKKFALTTKIDGGRIIAIKKNGEAKFYTRQGQEYEGLVDLKAEMEKYFPDNICLDGEITLLDPYVESSIPDFVSEDLWECEPAPRICTFTKLSSKDQYKKTMMITRRDGEKHGVKMLVFDYMTAEEFESRKCDTKYIDRRSQLEELFKRAEFIKGQEEDLPIFYFELLPTLYVGEDTTEITKWLNTNIANGEEGVMINICDAPYDFKRTNNLLKVKKMNDLDLEVVGFEEGTNSNAGRLGALLVNYKDNIVKVGSGFSQELREEIWNNKEEWLGRTVVVQYFEETTNQNGGISLRFPVYLDYRLDK